MFTSVRALSRHFKVDLFLLCTQRFHQVSCILSFCARSKIVVILGTMETKGRAMETVCRVLVWDDLEV